MSIVNGDAKRFCYNKSGSNAKKVKKKGEFLLLLQPIMRDPLNRNLARDFSRIIWPVSSLRVYERSPHEEK